MLCFQILFIFSFFFFNAEALAENVYPNSHYVRTQKGKIPIIITAPHGGFSDTASNILTQREEPNFELDCLGGHWTHQTDSDSLSLAELIVLAIEEEFGTKPYKVFAEISRKRIDFNRDPRYDHSRCAYDDSSGWDYWSAYHQSIQDYVNDIEERFATCGLLLDIHGTGRDSYEKTIVLGTGPTPGTTLPFRGADFLFGLDGLAFSLFQNGLDLPMQIIPLFSGDPTYIHLKGSYTVRRYSGTYEEFSTGPRIDAVQMEFGRALRGSDDTNILGESRRMLTARAVAKALHVVWNNHPTLCKSKSTPLMKSAPNTSKIKKNDSGSDEEDGDKPPKKYIFSPVRAGD